MSAPLVWIYVFFAAGVLAGMHLSAPFWTVVAACVCAGGSLCAKRLLPVFAAQALFFCILGQQMSSEYLRSYEENELRQWVRFAESEIVSVRGVVVRTPEIAEGFFALYMQVQSVRDQSFHGLVRLTVTGQPEEYPVAGDIIETFVRFRVPRNFHAPGVFDYEQYLRKEGVHVLGTVKSPVLLHKVGHQPSLRSLTSSLRLKLVLAIHRNFAAAGAQLLRALWLADRSALRQAT